MGLPRQGRSLPATHSRGGPPADNLVKRLEAIGQGRGSGLQNQRRLDLVKIAMPNGGNPLPTLARGHPLGAELAPAPRPDNQIRLTAHHLARVGNDPVAGQRPGAVFGKTVLAPAISTSSDTQRIPEISGSYHSSK